VLARELSFPEGPVYLGDGVVALTEMRGQCVTRYANGTTALVARTGGGTNGATVDADGVIWVANNGGLSLGSKGYWKLPTLLEGRIQRVAPDGTCTDASGDLPGELPHRPNDLCFGPDGKLYFTDPRNWEDLANLKVGRLWRFDPTTAAGDVLAEIPLFCNGIAFGPDPSRLYVAQTMGMKIFEFDWRAEGVGDPREWVTLPAGFPDGMCFSSEGDCYVCGATADVIQVFDADGTLKETVELPKGSDPTNCCLGDGTLYVTCSTSGELLAFDIGVEPLPLFPFR
jgi:gluconolactonase